MPAPQSISSSRRNSRREPLLETAARLFCQQGFAATSIREIARAVDMLPGSIYCHFDSKESLFLAVYGEGVRRIAERVGTAVDGRTEPWERLQLACRAHLQTILDQSDYAQVVIRVHPHEVPNMASRLIALRDEYESLFRDLIEAVDDIAPAHKRGFRLLLLGAMNWTQHWYHPRGQSPARIADEFLALLRAQHPSHEAAAHVE